MQLIKPFINTINAFDASLENVISFSILGGAIITSYTYRVYNSSGVVVYINTINVTNDVESVDIRTFGMSIPQNTLAFNTSYRIQVTISNPSLAPNITSISSNYANFTCYKTPTFTIQYIDSTFAYNTLTPNTAIKSDKIFAQLIFNKNDINSNALLNNATITLYGIEKITKAKVLIFVGEPLYNEPLQQTITGMISNTIQTSPYESYTLQVEGVTSEGLKFNQINVGTEESPILVSEISGITSTYLLISNSPNMRVSNLCDKGVIEIQSRFTDYEGESNPTPPIYIGNKEIDLTDPSAWVQWQNYFSVNQPYTLRLWGRKFANGEIVAQMLTDIVGKYAQIKYINDGTETYLILESFNIKEQGQQMFPYYIESNRVESALINDDTILFIGLQQDDNLYEVYLQIMN